MPYKDEEDGIMSQAQLMAMYRRASREGRLHPDIAAEFKLRTGDQKCKTCGMTAYTAEEAADCCTKPDRVLNGDQNSRKACYTGAIIDRPRFIAALEGLMITSEISWHPAYGVSRDAMRNLKNRVKTNSTQWLADETWTRLVQIFNGKVPGCAEITRGGVERAGKREVA